MKNFKKFLQIFILVIVFLAGTFNIVMAADNTSIIQPTCILPQTLDVVNNVCVNPTPTDPATTSTPVPTVTIHLTITTNSSSLYDKDITVNACNSDNNTTTNLNTTAYCAIQQSGLQNDWNWSWPPGAFLNSLDNIAGSTTKDINNNPVYHYWSWTLQRDPTISNSTGLNEYNLQANDVILLNFVDPIDSTSTPAPTTTAQTGTESGGGTVTSTTIQKNTFDTKKALDFLSSQQKADGSFGENIYTDWAAIAFASSPDYQDQKTKLATYFSTNKFSGTSITDNERHAMALMSLNLNPYNTSNENYINNIISNYDGKQFGDINQDNDDIFALIVLQNTGYTENDSMISNTINFILSKQENDGSWDSSVDMTGAAMEALASFGKNTDPLPTSPGGEEISNALAKAENFLKQNQKDNGGWNDNASGTAWIIEGILAQGEKPENWIKNENTPLDYLASIQDTDGGIKDSNIQNKIWETAYVTSALSSKTWNQTMQKFGKEDLPKVIVIKKTPITTQKPKVIKSDLPTQNTTSAVGDIVIPSSSKQIATPKKNWFTKILDSILGSF